MFSEKITDQYIEGVYLNNIRLDWVKMSVSQKGTMKDSPLDPQDVPDQISTNVRIGLKQYALTVRFNFNNQNKEQLYKNINDIFLKKQEVTIITGSEIIERCIILGMDRELDKYNHSFSMDVKQYQTAKITSTGNPAAGESTQVNQTTTVGTQGVTSSNPQGGYLT